MSAWKGVTAPHARGVRFNVALSATSKLITLVLNLVLVRQYLSYFGGNADVTGVWLSLVALLIAVVLFDFGVGNGLRNRLAEQIVHGDWLRGRQVVSSAYALLSLMLVPVGVISVAAIMMVDWQSLLSVPHHLVSSHAIRLCAVILLIGLGLYLILGLVSAVMNAAQLTGLSSVVSTVSNVLLVPLLLVVHLSDTDSALIALALMQVGCMLVPQLAASVLVYVRWFAALRPSARFVSRREMRHVGGISVQFLVIQAALVVINGVNEPLIATFTRPGDVYTYQAFNRLFTIFSIAFSVLVSPVWARMAADLVRGEIAGVLRLYGRMARIMWVFLVALALASPAIPLIVGAWYRVHPPNTGWIVALLGAQTALLICMYATTSLANAAGRLRPQVMTLGGGAVLKIPISFAVHAATGSWLAVIAANTLILAIVVTAQFIANRSTLRVAPASSA